VATSIEYLTRNFYDWELLGRGWRTYPYLVPLEPAFRPFPGHDIARSVIPDDARKPSFMSSLIERFTSNSTSPAAVALEPVEVDPPEIDATSERLEEIEILVPSDQKIDHALVDTWIRTTCATRRPVSFEVIGVDRTVTIRLAYSLEDDSLIRSQLRALFPDVTVRKAESSLLGLFVQGSLEHVAAMEFGLAREFMLPLRDLPKIPDPITTLIGAVAQAKSGELAVLQVLFEETRFPWAASGLEAVTSPDGRPFFLDAPQITSLAEEKFESPLYAAVIRVMANGPDGDNVEEILRGIASALNQYGDASRNGLVPLASNDLEELVQDILTRRTHRSGMLLSLPELTSFVRIPGEHVRNSALVRTIEPEETLPNEVLGNGAVIGRAKHGRAVVPVRLSDEARLQHTYVIGASGTGKSTFLENLILQDVTLGHGVGVVDPHGDLVDGILGRIPETRARDVVLFDPSDPDWIVGWNILGAHSDIEKELLASDLVAVFRRLSTSWGDQMSVVLANAVLAFLESETGGTLAELRRFLLDEAFRRGFLGTVQDDHVVSFWQEEFPLLVGKKPQAPILTRLDTFLRSRLIRAAVTERDKPLNFREIIDTRKIFLAKLSQGAIGEENAALLGSLIVSKFHQVSLSRQDITAKERLPFFLYLDEFHQMATPSMASLFSGVRKYRLGLTVAHQDLYQLHATAPEVERAALANAYTRVMFRVAEDDARRLERGAGDFTADDLTNLARAEAIVRVGRSENAFRMKTDPLPQVSERDADTRRAALRAISMERYGKPRLGVQGGSRTSVPIPEPIIQTERRARPPEEAAPRRAPLPTPQPGRGGPIHKYLQSFIREAGQAQGFRVDIEKELPGAKRVDVWLAREDLTIACEIAGTTTLEQEIANLRKCVAAGCDHVCAVSLDAAFLRRLATATSQEMTSQECERIQLFSPEEFLAFIGTKTVPVETKRVAGYDVKVRHSSGDASERDRKRAIADVMLKSVRRMRERK
jgi:hypothetical protein